MPVGFVTLDIDLEQFFHGFAVVMEGTQGQRFSFTQRRAFPSAAYLFEGKASGLNQGIHQPDVAVECRAYHHEMILSNLIEKQRLNRIIYYSVSKGNFFFTLVSLFDSPR